jgi:D-3-phosphoglycerate dehydrogenase
LINALETGKVLGAALDVLEFESISFENIEGIDLPKPLDYLFKSNNVVLSPHIAGWTNESHRKISEILADKILNIFK